MGIPFGGNVSVSGIALNSSDQVILASTVYGDPLRKSDFRTTLLSDSTGEPLQDVITDTPDHRNDYTERVAVDSQDAIIVGGDSSDSNTPGIRTQIHLVKYAAPR